MTNLLLRPYRPADAQATADVFHQAVTRTAATHYSPEQVAAWSPGDVDLTRWNSRRASAWTIVAEVDGQVVGFGDLRENELDMLFVHPDHGGRGIARALVTAVLGEARRRGLTEVTTRASRAARPAFERFGFVVTRDNPQNMVNGVAVPNHDMVVHLS